MTNAIAKQTPATLADLLEKQKSELEKVLPKHLSGDRLARIALSACSRSDDLMKCSAASILRAVMDAAKLGLEPSGSVGGAHLVAHWNSKAGVHEAVLMTDYRGEMELARRSGLISSITCHVVHERDTFDLVLGDDEHLTHRPALEADRGRAVGVYAIAHLKDGGKQRIYLSSEEVDHYRSKSRSRDKGPWVTDTLAMWRKTAIRRLCNMLPRSAEYADFVDRETEAELGPIEVKAEESPKEAAPSMGAGAKLVAQLGPGSEPAESSGELALARSRYSTAVSNLEGIIGAQRAKSVVDWHVKSMRGVRTVEAVAERIATVEQLTAIAQHERTLERCYARLESRLGNTGASQRFSDAGIPEDVFGRPLLSAETVAGFAARAESLVEEVEMEPMPAPEREPGADG